MFSTLYSKLAVALTLLFCLVGLLFMAIMRMSFVTYQDAVSQKLNHSMAEQLASKQVEARMREGGLDAVRAHFDELMTTHPAIELYLLDPGGRIFAFHAPGRKLLREKVDLEPILAFLKGNVDYPLRGDDPRDTSRRKVFSAAMIRNADANAAGYLYVIIGGEQYDAVMRELGVEQLLRQGFWIVAAGVLFATLAGMLAFAVLIRKLRRLAVVMESFRRSDFREKILMPSHLGSGDELDRLADTYNAIAERITAQLAALQQHDETWREMIANVSHDLRTPVASLRGYLETLLIKRDSATPEELRSYLEIATRQSERLALLVAELFELAKLDARDVRINPESFQLAELGFDVLQKFELVARTRGVALHPDISPDLAFVHADVGLIERVLENLIDNALQHTPASGRVTLRMAPSARGVEVSVEDTGSGIAEHDLAHVFERFYRVDKSRNLSSGGAGLGLAIAMRIVNLHGARICASSRVGAGTSFSFVLPAQAPPANTAGAVQ